MIFAAHRVLGYSSNDWYGQEGAYEEPMGRDGLQKLWQKYKVDIAFYGHVHNYERSCPIYQVRNANTERSSNLQCLVWYVISTYNLTDYCGVWFVQNRCVNKERNHYSGTVNGTIHVVVGGAGSHLSKFSPLIPYWSIYRDYDFGFVKLTALNQSSLLFEYKKSRDGKVYDSFTISRDYKDVLACVHDGCEPTTLAS